jgi:hypothetical protein
VLRTGDAISLYGAPQYTGAGTVTDEVRRELWAKDTAAKARLARLAQQRREAQHNALDEALEPLITVARTLRRSADRDAFIAYVLRRLISAR